MLRTWFERFFQTKKSTQAIRPRQRRPASYLLRLEMLEDRFAPAGIWTETGALNTAVGFGTATLLGNGEVLVAGGALNNSPYITATAELYNPTTSAWSTTGSLNSARDEDTATLLNNGEVLVAGGNSPNGLLASAELYDPVAGTWSATGSLNTARAGATATLLNNGEVLVAGGYDAIGNVLSSAELYNPTSGTWSSTGSLSSPGEGDTATLLNNGEVLVAGGNNRYGYLSNAELYNPTTGTWSPTGSLNAARVDATATLLNNGEVLVAGGYGVGNVFLSDAELYDPTAGSWSSTGSLANPRGFALATLLGTGEVLVTGGEGDTAALSSSELFNPATNSWSATASLNTGHDSASTLTLLNNGQVLVAGGNYNLRLTDSELYNPFTTTNAAFTYGTPGSSTVAAWNAAPPASYTFTSTDLPSWATLDPTTGILSGTPSAVGSQSVTVTASNGTSSDSASFTLTVNKAAPTLTVSAAGGAYDGSAFAATVTVAGVDNIPGPSLEGQTSTLTYYAGSAATGTPLAGPPTEAGTYTVVASFPGSTDYAAGSATASSFTLDTLASFAASNFHGGANGAQPNGGLLEDSNGNFFGTTLTGGVDGGGTIFELVKSSGALVTLASFYNSVGDQPNSGLVEDSSGDLFGTTQGGGVNGAGTIFEWVKSSGALVDLAIFNYTDGSSRGGLVADSSGDLFGTADWGGQDGAGTLFEWVKSSGALVTLVNFNVNGNGDDPFGGLFEDSSGNLFGTTNYSGANNDGTLFEWVPSGVASGTFNTLASFNGADGANPFGNLIEDTSGNLFGTTSNGGVNGDGAVFEWVNSTSTLVALASFNGGDGSYPLTGLVEDGSGNLFGTTTGGGAYGSGNVFEYVQSSGALNTLVSFNGLDGSYPGQGSLVASDGVLFGTTGSGGPEGAGTIFSLGIQAAFTIAPASQQITFAPLAPISGAGDVALGATASSGLAVSYTVVAGPATVSGNTLDVTGAGIVILQASQAGDNDYLPAPAVEQTLLVSPAQASLATDTIPAITFAPSSPVTYSPGLTVTLSDAGGGSSSPVVFTALFGPGYTSGTNGTTLNVTGAGSILVEATQAGDGNYSAAAPVFATLTVAPRSLGSTALFEGPAAGSDADIVVSGGAWTAASNAAWLHTSASGAGNGLAAFTFDANTGATRTGTLTIAGLTLTVTQAGVNYAAANPLPTLVSPGASIPNALAVDAAGNVYIAEVAQSSDPIVEWNAMTQTPTPLGNGPGAQAIAVDAAGNVYIAAGGYNPLTEWNAATQTVSTLVSSGLNGPQGVAVDAAGNVYIADTGDNDIKEWNAATQTVSTLVSSGLNGPQGVAVDAAGNVYIADTGDNAIKEWNAATQMVSTLVSSGLNGPDGVAVDAAGNVYIADTGDNDIKEWNAATQTVATLVSSGLSYPRNMAVDRAGDVYTESAGSIKELVKAYVPAAPGNELAAAGSDSLAVVLPTTQSLTGVFAPTSDQSWLTLGTPANGVVPFSFSANTGAARTAHITLLGQQITINQANDPADIITFGPIAPVALGAGPITLDAVGGGSSNPVVYTVLFGPGHVSGSQLTPTGVGQILIEATQAGDTNYLAATPVFQSVEVEKAQTITFTKPAPIAFTTAPITLSAAASSTLQVTFSVVSGPGTISNGKLTITGVGSIVIEADQAGNGIYAAAAPVQRTLVVNKANQTTTFAAHAAVTYGVAPITLGATASSALPVSYKVVSGPGTINGSVLTITGAGAIVIQASQAGSGDYNSAPAATQTLTVNKATLIVAAAATTWTAGLSGQTLAGFTITGFVDGDTEAALFAAEAAAVSCPTVNTNNPKAGAYVILITQGSLVTPANYKLTFLTAKLTVH